MTRELPRVQVFSDVLAIIKEFEGLHLEEYICPAGIPTIGYGHTGGGTPLVIDARQAEDLLRLDVDEAADKADALVGRHKLNNWQFGALVSLCFNVKTSVLQDDSIIKKLRAGDMSGAAGDWWQLRRGDGKILAGLQARRSAEVHYFLTGEYYGLSRGYYKVGGPLFYGPEG